MFLRYHSGKRLYDACFSGVADQGVCTFHTHHTEEIGRSYFQMAT